MLRKLAVVRFIQLPACVLAQFLRRRMTPQHLPAPFRRNPVGVSQVVPGLFKCLDSFLFIRNILLETVFTGIFASLAISLYLRLCT